MTVTVQPTYKSYLNIGLETTQGDAVTGAYSIPVTKFSLFSPQAMKLPDKGYRGAPVDVYNEVAGVLGTNYAYDADVFADAIGWPLVGVLGTEDITGTTAPYSHVITAYNGGNFQPPSYTLVDEYAAQCRQVPGFVYSEVAFNFTIDGMFTYTTKGLAWSSSDVAAPATAFSNLAPQAAWILTATIAGAQSFLVEDGTLTISRENVKPIYTGGNTQNPLIIWSSGAVIVEGKLGLIMQNDTELNRFLNNTPTTLVLDWAQGSGATAEEVKFTMSKVQYLTGDIDRSKDYIVLPVTFKALGNTTDIGVSGGYSPIKVTVKNAIAGSVYK